MKTDYPRRRVVKVHCAKCHLLRIVTGHMTRKEVEAMKRKYICTDHEKRRGEQ